MLSLLLPAAILTQHVLCPCGADDDLSAHGGHTDLHTTVAILCELPCQELIELGVKHAICNELRSQPEAGAAETVNHLMHSFLTRNNSLIT